MNERGATILVRGWNPCHDPIAGAWGRGPVPGHLMPKPSRQLRAPRASRAQNLIAPALLFDDTRWDQLRVALAVHLRFEKTVPTQ